MKLKIINPPNCAFDTCEFEEEKSIKKSNHIHDKLE